MGSQLRALLVRLVHLRYANTRIGISEGTLDCYLLRARLTGYHFVQRCNFANYQNSLFASGPGITNRKESVVAGQAIRLN